MSGDAGIRYLPVTGGRCRMAGEVDTVTLSPDEHSRVEVPRIANANAPPAVRGTTKPDFDEISRAIPRMFGEDTVLEPRGPKAGKAGTVSGYSTTGRDLRAPHAW